MPLQEKVGAVEGVWRGRGLDEKNGETAEPLLIREVLQHEDAFSLRVMGPAQLPASVAISLIA